MYARIEVGIFHNRGNLCNEKSGLQQNPFQIRGYSRIENSRIEVLLYSHGALYHCSIYFYNGNMQQKILINSKWFSLQNCGEGFIVKSLCIVSFRVV